jgi:hypothetical protein
MEFLDPGELAQLTGYKHATQQREWLEDYGWTHAVNAAGKPVVNRHYARQKLGLQTAIATTGPTDWRPDFKGLNHEAKKQ